jgi:hypothetical protein
MFIEVVHASEPGQSPQPLLQPRTTHPLLRKLQTSVTRSHKRYRSRENLAGMALLGCERCKMISRKRKTSRTRPRRRRRTQRSLQTMKGQIPEAERRLWSSDSICVGEDEVTGCDVQMYSRRVDDIKLVKDMDTFTVCLTSVKPYSTSLAMPRYLRRLRNDSEAFFLSPSTVVNLSAHTCGTKSSRRGAHR